jgi:hypothetical protein
MDWSWFIAVYNRHKTSTFNPFQTAAAAQRLRGSAEDFTSFARILKN